MYYCNLNAYHCTVCTKVFYANNYKMSCANGWVTRVFCFVFVLYFLSLFSFLLLRSQVYGAGGDRHDRYKVSDTVLEVKNETSGKVHELKLSHFWPVRKPRPVLEKLPGNSALTTGLRVIDTIFP